MNSTFPTTGIRSEGWQDWNKPHDRIRYAEYNNRTVDGSLLATTERAPWSRQLSEAEAKEITVEKVLGFVDIVSLQ